jgi:hypothetical protein
MISDAFSSAFTLFELFERKLEMHQGHLVKAAVELAKDWRTDRPFRCFPAARERRPGHMARRSQSQSNRFLAEPRRRYR